MYFLFIFQILNLLVLNYVKIVYDAYHGILNMFKTPLLLFLKDPITRLLHPHSHQIHNYNK